jgi:hypothetical protein
MKTLLTISIVACLSFVAWLTVATVRHIQFTQQCGGYLQRAARANTIELAEREMTIAVSYLERHGITSGYTSVFWCTPDEDVGFWYRNLSAALAELRSIDAHASALERSNVLLKLRETLVSQEHAVPPSVSLYPYNTAFAYWGLLSFGITGMATAAAWIVDLKR